MSQFIPLSVPNLCGNELAYISQAIKTQWVSTGGSYITDFEETVAAYTKMPNAVACQSGTAGIHLALMACGVKGDVEVLVPTLTFIASVNPVRYVGAHPVFMDCDDTLAIDSDKVEDFCQNCCRIQDGRLFNKSSGRPVVAIVCVHIFGNLANMEKLCEIASRYHLTVIEDACEAIGSYWESGKYAGRMAGTVGDIGVYSFNGNKIITTGGGGMIVSKDQALLDRCRHLSTQAKTDTLYFIHDEVGYNYRMTNLQAAMGVAQMELLEGFIERKMEIYRRYQDAGIPLLPFCKNIRANYWFFSMITSRRDSCIRYLEEHHIQSRPIWALIHTLRPYQEEASYHIEKAIYYYERIVNIPCSTNLTNEDADRVIKVLQAFEQE